jgi:hypothetical protein
MNVRGKRIAAVPDPLEVDEVITKKLCVRDQYCLPENAGTAGQVIKYPAAGDQLEWADLGDIANVLQREVLFESVSLADFQGTVAGFPTEYNREFKDITLSSVLPSVQQAFPWAGQSFKCQQYIQEPLSVPGNEWDELGLGGGSLPGIVFQHLHGPVVPIATQNWREADYVELTVRITSGGVGAPPTIEEYFDIFVVFQGPGDLPPPDPVFNADYALAVGTRFRIAENVRSWGTEEDKQGINNQFSFRINPKRVGQSTHFKVVFQHKGSNYGQVANHWLSHGVSPDGHLSIFGSIVAALKVSLVVTADGEGVVLPENQINHLNIQNVGVNTHAQLDAHVLDYESKVDQDVRTTANPSFNGLTVYNPVGATFLNMKSGSTNILAFQDGAGSTKQFVGCVTLNEEVTFSHASNNRYLIGRAGPPYQAEAPNGLQVLGGLRLTNYDLPASNATGEPYDVLVLNSAKTALEFKRNRALFSASQSALVPVGVGVTFTVEYDTLHANDNFVYDGTSTLTVQETGLYQMHFRAVFQFTETAPAGTLGALAYIVAAGAQVGAHRIVVSNPQPGAQQTYTLECNALRYLTAGVHTIFAQVVNGSSNDAITLVPNAGGISLSVFRL